MYAFLVKQWMNELVRSNVWRVALKINGCVDMIEVINSCVSPLLSPGARAPLCLADKK